MFRVWVNESDARDTRVFLTPAVSEDIAVSMFDVCATSWAGFGRVFGIVRVS